MATLQYFKEYRTYEQIAADFGIHESTLIRKSHWIEDTLSKQGFALTTQTPTEDAKFILADGGYQGIKHLHANAFIPLKATKKYPLVQEAKDYNALLSKTRVRVEHIFAKFKAFKMLRTTYRKSLARFELRVKLVFGWIGQFCRMSYEQIWVVC